jgi:hypothetical protein
MLTACALSSIQRQTCRARFGDKFFVFISDVTFHIAKGPSSLDDLRFGCEFGVPYGPEKIDFEFDRRERFILA